MAEDPRKILAMTDRDLQLWALSGESNSYVLELGRTAMDMRCSLRMVEASNQMTAATESLAEKTERLASATWGIVIITLITQIALIALTVIHK
jgi:hypothetical protein